MGDIFALVVWAITGAVVLASRQEVSKFAYGATWFVLMIALFCNCVE